MKWILAIALLLGVGVFLSQSKETIDSLSNLTFQQAFLLFLTTLASFLFMAYQFRITMQFPGLKLTPTEWFGLSMCNAMYNQFLPARSGIWMRAYYLKEKYHFSYTHYVSLMLSSFFLMFVSAGILGMATIGLAMWQLNRDLWFFFSLFPGLILLTTLIWFAINKLVYSSRQVKFQRARDFLENFHAGLAFFKDKPFLIMEYIVTAKCSIICNGLAYALSLYSLGEDDISILVVIAVMALTAFSSLVTLTPGNLGVREMIMGFTCHQLGVSLETALLAAYIVRAVTVVCVFFLGVLYSKILFQNLSIPSRTPA